jgi:hypothetical protein
MKESASPATATSRRAFLRNSSLVIAGSTTSDSRSPTTSSDVVSQRNASNRSQRAAMA